MNKPVVEIKVRAVLPTAAGRAVFLGNEEKSFVIYVDENVGSAITMFMSGTPKERPLTHDLMGHLMTSLGAKVERVIINDMKTATYFARLIVSANGFSLECYVVLEDSGAVIIDALRIADIEAGLGHNLALADNASSTVTRRASWS